MDNELDLQLELVKTEKQEEEEKFNKLRESYKELNIKADEILKRIRERKEKILSINTNNYK